MIKAAHFGVFAPNASGQYATVKDLVLAERSVGIDAQFVDYGYGGKPACRQGMVDGEITTAPLSWAYDEADIIIRHSVEPKKLSDSKPSIFALHGRPEYSFRLEQYDLTKVMTTLMDSAKSGRYRAFFTFWPEHVHTWSWMMPSINMRCVSAPVDLDEFNMDGEKHNFGIHNGSPNIVITDRWREDTTPFNIVYAAQYFREHYCPTAKLHIYGIPSNNSCVDFLSPLKKSGLTGEILGIIRGLQKVYRSADILITPNIIATRVVREAMASGLPIVAPNGCGYTKYVAEPRDYVSFAKAINDCYTEINHETKQDIRDRAVNEFGLERVGLEMKALFEDVLSGDAVKINAMSINSDEWLALKRVTKDYEVKDVVEFGSGLSTGLFNDLGLNIRSLETNGRMVNGNVELWDGESIQEIHSDMAFIDGPHGGKNREPSYRTVAESNIPIVACHDAHRAEDRVWIDKYFGGWEVISDAPNTLRVLQRP